MPSYHGRLNVWREDDFVLILFNLYLQNKSNQHFLLTMSFFLDKLLATGGYNGSTIVFGFHTPSHLVFITSGGDQKKDLFFVFLNFLFYIGI